MKIWDLTSGMVVRTKEKEGSLYTVIKDAQIGGKLNEPKTVIANVLLSETGFLNLEDYNEDLTFKIWSRDKKEAEFDIIEVYVPKIIPALYQDIDEAALKSKWECIWKREDEDKPVELTMEDLERILCVKHLKIVSKK